MAKRSGKKGGSNASKEGSAEPKADPTPVETAPKPEVKRSTGNYDGAHLRKIRENKGLTLKDISQRTKINLKVLTALEEERYEDMPLARVYVWGFVRCLAEEIGLDMHEVAAAYVPRWERWYEKHQPKY